MIDEVSWGLKSGTGVQRIYIGKDIEANVPGHDSNLIKSIEMEQTRSG